MSGWELLDHHDGKQSDCELQQLNKKVAGVGKQTVLLIPSCCVSPKAVTYDSFTDWTSQQEQRKVSGRDLSEQELMKSQSEHTRNRITPSCSLFDFLSTLCTFEPTKTN